MQRYRRVKGFDAIVVLRIATEGGAVDFILYWIFLFFKFYRVSSSTPQNYTLPQCSFIVCEIFEALQYWSVSMWNGCKNPSSSRHWRCNIIFQHISADMPCTVALAVGHAAEDLLRLIQSMHHYNALCFLPHKKKIGDIEPLTLASNTCPQNLSWHGCRWLK